MSAVSNFLSLLNGVRRTGPRQWEARCPAHDDQRPSLSVSEGDDGRVLVYCQAGCHLLQVIRPLGVSVGSLHPSGKIPPSRLAKGKSETIVAEYDYCGIDGELLYQVVRFDPKGFRQRRPDGKGGWTWTLGDTPRVLYRLPELVAAPIGETALVCEGEKDSDRLAALGFVSTCNPGGAGKWECLSDDSALNGRTIVIIADNDPPGRKHAHQVESILQPRAASVRVVTVPNGKDISEWLASIADDTARDMVRILIADAPSESPIATIIVGVDRHRCVTEAATAFANDPGIYHRAFELVEVVPCPQTPVAGGIRRSGKDKIIRTLARETVAHRLTRSMRFEKLVQTKQSPGLPSAPAGRAAVATNGTKPSFASEPTHPPDWLVGGVWRLGNWPEMRYLAGISDFPVLRADGSIWQRPGYDRETCILYDPPADSPGVAVPETLTQDHAVDAVATLLETVCDFPFESDAHRSAWLAAVLTPLARSAFDGPAPLFLVDANVRGAGKTLLVQTIGRIVLGRDAPAGGYSSEPIENAKKITSIAVAGDRLFLFDNIAGALGDEAIDRALTSTMWQERILGTNNIPVLPLYTTWYATGNNVRIKADTIRRIVHVRLDSPDEAPEHRHGFRHTDLLRWVRNHRPQLMTAALSLLAAYIRCGQPDTSLRPFGSFEAWSGLVREAIVWAGMPDPCMTRDRLEETSDESGDVRRMFVAAWREKDHFGYGLVVADLIADLYRTPKPQGPGDELMRVAIDAITGVRAGQTPNARMLSYALRSLRGTPIDGWRFVATEKDHTGREVRGGRKWHLEAIQRDDG